MAFGFKIRYTDVICNGSFKNIYCQEQAVGYGFDIRLGYYRGLFLSCIDQFEIIVNGERVPAEDVTFSINNKEFCSYQLSDCVTEFWRLIEPAKIQVIKKGGLTPGKHQVEVVLMLRVPYLPIQGEDGGRHYMPINSCEEKVLALKEGRDE